MVEKALNSVERQVVDQVGDFKHLSQQSDDVMMRFVTFMNNNFDELLDKEVVKDEAIFNFETLSLVQEEELEVIVALEGMVNAARNEHLPVFISFNTRLSSLFPRKRIDESSNPLDPDQIATSFQEALRPVGLDAQNTLSVYRAFNRHVLKHLNEVVNEANTILIESKVIPDLGMEGAQRGRQPERARSRSRDDIVGFGTVEEDVFDEDADRPELFSMMQNLLHSDEPATSAGADADGSAAASGAQVRTGDFTGAPAGVGPGTGSGQVMVPAGQQYMIPAGMIPAGMVPAGQAGQQSGVMQPFQPTDGQQVEMVDQTKLIEILTNIQETLKTRTPQDVPNSMEDIERLDISQSLGEILKATAQDDNTVSAVDRQSSDVINLVTLLYEAIWQDQSVPIPIKELIGRTQITIIKVALADVDFFNNETHPARSILNEFASAGIGWTEVENLDQDPLYQKIQALVERILLEYENNNELFEDLITDFRTFRAMEKAKVRHLEQRILKAEERKERLDDIHELVTQKIQERVLGRDLHPFVNELLNGPFHKFMVMLVLKEGPGGNAWKQAINTIDVLLWSVQPHEQDGDRDRLETVNPRLLNNLRKALRIAAVEKEEVNELIEQLERVQTETFHSSDSDKPADIDSSEINEIEEPETDQTDSPETEPENTARSSSVTFLAAGDEAKPATQSDKAGPDGEAETANLAATPEATEGADAKEGIESIEGTEGLVGDDDSAPLEFGEKTAAQTAEDADDTGANADESNAPVTVKNAKKDDAANNDLPDNDPSLIQVENLTVGMWVEFIGEEDHNTRCKLAAKINAIDKFIFVNRQGVKVVEKTKMGLAREIHDGTVNIISDGLLFSRALESVIGNLRESQQEQQTGSAYQPDQSEA